MTDNQDFENEQELVTKYFGPEKESKKVFLIFSLAFLGTMAVLFLIWFFFLKQNGTDKLDEITVIEAEAGDIKIKPTDPGGEKIDHLDKSIYNTIAKKKENLPKVEKLTDFEAEEKIIGEEVINHHNKIEHLASKEYKKRSFKEEKPKTEADFVEVVIKQEINKNKDLAAEEPKTNLASARDTKLESHQNESNSIRIIKKEDIKDLPINNKIKQKYNKADAPAEIKPGIYIQLASLKSKQIAETNISNLSSKHKDILQQYGFEIEEKMMEGKGKFYRVQVGQIEDYPTAKKLCTILNERKENCFIVKK